MSFQHDGKDIKTQAGRTIKPSLKQLESSLNIIEREFLTSVGTVKDVPNDCPEFIKEKKKELRIIWRQYEETFNALTGLLTASGHVDLSTQNSSFIDLRKSYKAAIRQLTQLLKELGEEVSSYASSSVGCASDVGEEDKQNAHSLYQVQLSDHLAVQTSNPPPQSSQDNSFAVSHWLSEAETSQPSVRPRVTTTGVSQQTKILAPIYTSQHPSSLHPTVSQVTSLNPYTSSSLYPPFSPHMSTHASTAGSAYQPRFAYNSLVQTTTLGIPSAVRDRVTWADPQTNPIPQSTRYTPISTSAHDAYPPDWNSTFTGTPPYVTHSPATHVDATSRHIELSTLKRESSDPYKGEPHRFTTWIASINHRLDNIQALPMDRIDVLEAQSAGDVKRAIQTYRSMYGSNPSAALNLIMKTLNKRFGSPRVIANELKRQVTEFSPIRGQQTDSHVANEIRRMSDLCNLINAHMEQVPDLKTFNYESELELIRTKLPAFVNNKWQTIKGDHFIEFATHPNFSKFCGFLERYADIMCSDTRPQSVDTKSTNKHARVLTVSTDLPTEGIEKCLIHKTDNHQIQDCKAFSNMAPSARKLLISSHNRCYKCMGIHAGSRCNNTVKCDICNRNNHVTLLHQDSRKYNESSLPKDRPTTSERREYSNNTQVLLVREEYPAVKSCSKTVLVDISTEDDPSHKFRTYCIIDDQSSHSFASPELRLEEWQRDSLSRELDPQESFRLPVLYENHYIPDKKDEVATPAVVRGIKHLSHLSSFFLDIDKKSNACVLLGRDAGNILACDQKGSKAPFACRTPLGWALIGIVRNRKPKHNRPISVLRTTLEDEHFAVTPKFAPRHTSVFLKQNDDDLPGFSIQDKKFMKIIENHMEISKEGNIQAPLPFKKEDFKFPENIFMVYRRQKNCLDRIKRDPQKLRECLSCMQKFIASRHVERVPDSELCVPVHKTWHIPIFPVMHPRKKTLRLVFDSAASFQNTSLNSTLLKGPDQNNTLRGVLMRFREGVVGFVADVESMFHSFHVSPEHRDFLRFFWFKENEPNKELVQYRARVHVFGNTCSPAVATMALRYAAKSVERSGSEDEQSPVQAAAISYIHRNFYVDDGLGTASSAQEAIAILKTAKSALSKFNIRLCKIMSNDQQVPHAFPESERSSPAVLDFNDSALHRTLGVAWDVEADKFIIKVNMPVRSFTKRGILAVVNSIYDPMGLASPVVLQGRLIQRTILPRKSDGDENINKLDWDDPLPEKYYRTWKEWKESLVDLDSLAIPRSFSSHKFGKPSGFTLHAFCDASKDAIGNVIYLRFTNIQSEVQVAFLCGDSKVAPRGAISIPRLELCAAVEVSLTVQNVLSELTHKPNSVSFYTDSLVLLGYLNNEEKRFSRYVERRIEIIQRSSNSSQWKFVSSDLNPADIASRAMSAKSLRDSDWYTGPMFLRSTGLPKNTDTKLEHSQISELPEEEEKRMTVLTTSKEKATSFFEDTFIRVSKWTSIIRIAKNVLKYLFLRHDMKKKLKLGVINSPRNPETLRTLAIKWLIADAQHYSFNDVFKLKSETCLHPKHRLAQLSPIIYSDGLLRVGGRLKRSDVPESVKLPILLPRDHPISVSVLTHYHERVQHQGRYITRGALREAGFHLENCNRILRKLLTDCIICKKLRGRLEVQRMSDLPPDRVERAPPFTNTGLDVMGPWSVRDGRKTRTNATTKKAWALVFTCLVSRAVHVEMLSSLDTPTFKNAFRRFLAVRGHCKIVRSDRGTNFIGAYNEDLDLKIINADLEASGCRWVFNPPHSSNFGGVWERVIGQLRRILDSSLIHIRAGPIDRDDLYTFLMEACAVINNTPMWEVSVNAEDSQPITPNMLLTLKDSQDHVEPFAYNEDDAAAYGKRRWRRVQFLADKFWKLWQQHYLQCLQVRKKWLKPRKSLDVGDVVLLREKDNRRSYWPYGLIEKVNLSSDGLVRSVALKVVKLDANRKVKISRLVRPISDLVLLISNVEST